MSNRSKIDDSWGKTLWQRKTTGFREAADATVRQAGPKNGCHHWNTVKSGANPAIARPARNHVTGLSESMILSESTRSGDWLSSYWVLPGNSSDG
jgi:hypothetical protein